MSMVNYIVDEDGDVIIFEDDISAKNYCINWLNRTLAEHLTDLGGVRRWSEGQERQRFSEALLCSDILHALSTDNLSYDDVCNLVYKYKNEYMDLGDEPSIRIFTTDTSSNIEVVPADFSSVNFDIIDDILNDYSVEVGTFIKN